MYPDFYVGSWGFEGFFFSGVTGFLGVSGFEGFS